MFLGIDLGTSGVKVVLVDDEQRRVDQAVMPLAVSRPQPLWSEQDPEDWWQATTNAVSELRGRRARELAGVRAIGLSGQMHGATLLDTEDRVLRSAILWNDGRSAEECQILESRCPSLRAITGNLAMPGFTAPKLLWVARHEPETFARVAKVLLPKDYLRLRMTGDYASDLSDSAGTLWLDVGARRWSTEVLDATGLAISKMPALFEGSAATGVLRAEVASAWGVPERTIVAAGAGDNAAAAVGAGVIVSESALLSLGTSGVLFVANDRFLPNPGRAVHAFCHALPATWHQMSVILSAASCLTWIAHATSAPSEGVLLDEIEARGQMTPDLVFLPYLSGERTPINDPMAMGVFFGLSHDVTRADLGRAVLEGVAFAFADGADALTEGGARLANIAVVGGGSRSPLWGRILATALDRPLHYHDGAELGPALGATRLARLALTGEDPRAVCTMPATMRTIEPVVAWANHYREKRVRYHQLYDRLREVFRVHLVAPREIQAGSS